MAARCLTILRILFTPSERADGWRLRVLDACREAGWAFHDYSGGEAPLVDNAKAVVMGANFEALPYAVDHHIVLVSTPDEVMGYFQEGPPERSSQEARYHAAAYLAGAEAKIARGALQISQACEGFDLPGLGWVNGPATTRGAVTPRTAGSLDLFARLPIEAGATQRWSTELLTFYGATNAETEGMRIELTGRRRLLFNGPNLALPPGEWIVHAAFTIADDCNPELLIEWGYQTNVASLSHTFAMGGHYELELSYVWTQVAPADFRISLMTSMLHGDMTLQGLTVRKA